MQKLFLMVIAVVLLFGAGFFFLQQQEVTDPENGNQIEDNGVEDLENITKEDLLLRLKEAADIDDYASFGKYLKVAYDKGWDKEDDFNNMERSVSVKADEAYFIPGDYEKTLEVFTILYNAVPQSHRFMYLRVLALEKLGRLALAGNDLQEAEERALTILKMTFRPEGAHLLADVYMEKIEASIASGNKTEAQELLDYIWAFEVNEERRTQLVDLKALILLF
ncbi:MAG TPA: hypothetical protein ENI04_00030 [Candidatus Wildermuthbacteria bacterium]|nr:hypothetical protein [Candidatus Wildermuthbacteria bacterium]